MYSLLKRVPATSVCVSPDATRSWRSRSPKREPGAVGRAVVGRRARLDICGFKEVNLILDSSATLAKGVPPKRGMVDGVTREPGEVQNHLTELLDTTG